MELDSEHIPVITVECGGAHEDSADRLALAGLERYFSADDLQQTPAADWALDIYYHPMRMELAGPAAIHYGEEAGPAGGICLKVDIERHNFGIVTPETLLGWIDADTARQLRVRDAAGNNRFDELYEIREGCLFPRCRQKLFMITGNPVIARSDCLWYAVTD